MPGILTLLASRKKELMTGEVESRDGVFYMVRIGTRLLRAKSAIADAPGTGALVVVARTDEGLFLVGAESAKDRQRVEVVIDG